MAKQTFAVNINELLSRTVEVEAEDIHDALDKAKEMYRNGEIVLDESDFVDTEITIPSVSDSNRKKTLRYNENERI